MKSQVGVLIALLSILWGGCKSDSPGTSSDPDDKCVDGDPDCGDECDGDHACPAGLFCDHQQCVKECVAPKKSSDESTCGEGQECDADGRCVDAGSTGGDGGAGKDGSTSDGGGDGDDAGKGGAGKGGGKNKDAGPVCGPISVTASRVEPTVILIVDQSVSMNEVLDDDTRWNTLRDFLLGKDGVIADLQKEVQFGLALYSAMSNEDGAGPLPVGECPVVNTVKPAYDNYDAIADVYKEAEPIDDGPTGDSIEKVIEQLDLEHKDSDVGTNTVFVLATDGEPDRCEELDPPTEMARMESIAAVTHAFSLGVRTYVIDVGGEIGMMHQQQLANAGLGLMPGQKDAEFWTAADGASLRDALKAIVTSRLGCEIALDASVADGTACDGKVVLNGAELECDGEDGWKLVDPSHVQLLGDACAELKQSEAVTLEASFPCAYAD
jgi:hypothetical protein